MKKGKQTREIICAGIFFVSCTGRQGRQKEKKKNLKNVASSEAPVKGKKWLWVFDAWGMAGGLLEWAQGPCFQLTDPPQRILWNFRATAKFIVETKRKRTKDYKEYVQIIKQENSILPFYLGMKWHVHKDVHLKKYSEEGAIQK